MTDKTDWSHDSVSIKNSDNSYFMNFKTKEEYDSFRESALHIIGVHNAMKSEKYGVAIKVIAAIIMTLKYGSYCTVIYCAGKMIERLI